MKDKSIKILEINDLYKLAKKRVPKMFFEYADTGSWTSSTYKSNEEDFKHIKFRQRVAKDMSNRTLNVDVLSQKLDFPIALSPIGICGFQYANGEILAAKAAEKKRSSFHIINNERLFYRGCCGKYIEAFLVSVVYDER